MTIYLKIPKKVGLNSCSAFCKWVRLDRKQQVTGVKISAESSPTERREVIPSRQDPTEILIITNVQEVVFPNLGFIV